MTYNLTSPNNIVGSCNFKDLMGWFQTELGYVPVREERTLLLQVAKHLDYFVRWPEKAMLLWPGCHRCPDPGKKQKYHKYPRQIRNLAKERRIDLDSRANGPAVAAFLLAGGERPSRFGSSNAWSVHHLYSGKFPYVGRMDSLHAAKHGQHFTQSAGLVAIHPIADALADEYALFAWLLRAGAFMRFAYDPDRVFCSKTSTSGFADMRGQGSGRMSRDYPLLHWDQRQEVQD